MWNLTLDKRQKMYDMEIELEFLKDFLIFFFCCRWKCSYKYSIKYSKKFESSLFYIPLHRHGCETAAKLKTKSIKSSWKWRQFAFIFNLSRVKNVLIFMRCEFPEYALVFLPFFRVSYLGYDDIWWCVMIVWQPELSLKKFLDVFEKNRTFLCFFWSIELSNVRP